MLLGYHPTVTPHADTRGVLHRRGVVAGAIDRGLGQAVGGDANANSGSERPETATRNCLRMTPLAVVEDAHRQTSTAREGAVDAENPGVWTRDRQEGTVYAQRRRCRCMMESSPSG
jgi:hypothetical protein